MEASKLTIDPKHLQFKPMQRAERVRLRRKNIKSLIRNTPAGTPIKLKEFQFVTANRDRIEKLEGKHE